MRFALLLCIGLWLSACATTIAEEASDAIGRLDATVDSLIEAGRYAEALSPIRDLLARYEAELGPDHPYTLNRVANLGIAYYYLGHYGEAEPFYRRVLEDRERVLGSHHPETLTSVNNLGLLCQTRGRFGEAELLYRRALEGRERVLGPGHLDTLTSVNNLGYLYHAQGRYGEAETLYRRALNGRERMLGSDHPDTLTTVNNMGALQHSGGRLHDAEPLYRRALEGRERVLGPDHPDTLTSLNNLAALKKSQFRFEEAETLYRRGLEGREKVLGPDHSDTLQIATSLGSLYQAQRRYGEAESLYRRVLEASGRLLGPDHPVTLNSVHNLGFLYHAQGRHGEAEPLYRRAAEASERVLGSDHPDTASSRVNLAVLLVETDREEEAVRVFRELDLGLSQWIDLEIQNTRAATTRRQMLSQLSGHQDMAFNFALARPSAQAARLAADLTLRWKKRLAKDDAVLSNLARESRDPALGNAIAAVRRGRAALSNVAFDPGVQAAEKVRLRETLDTAEAALRTKSAKFAQFQTVKFAKADDVQATLRRGSALVEYRFFESVGFSFENARFQVTRLLAVVLTPDAAPVLIDLGEADPIVALIRVIVDTELRSASLPLFGDLAQTGYERLIAPLLPHLGDAETVYIAPDGPLHALPFDALLDPNGWRLAERLHVRMVQTGRDLVARDLPTIGKGLVVVGGVDFGSGSADQQAAAPSASVVATTDGTRAALVTTREQLLNFGPLRESLAEAQDIAAAYAAFRPSEPAPVVLSGLGATEAALKGLVVPPRVLHLATHGYYLATGSIDGQPLLQSGVALAGANRALAGGIGADGENGILHAVEAQTLNLYGTELVVLSACHTGKGVVDYSEGLEGLPRALYVAGAKNVLVALWRVGDNAARNFMERFYEIWLAHPISDPNLALRQTKLDYIRSSDPARRDPQLWAPFVLFEG